MDDDLRSRFRSTRRSYDVPPVRRAPAPARPPQKAPEKPASAPLAEPVWAQRPSPRPRPAEPEVAETPTPKPAKKSEQHKTRKKRSLRKKLLVALPIFILLGGGAGAYTVFIKKPAPTKEQPQVQSASTQPEESKVTGTIRMVAVGDSLAFESLNNAVKAAGGSYAPMMDNFKPLFAKADIRLCNETTIGGGDALGISGYPSFNAPTSWSTSFAEAGCNLMNLGSDHTNDKGQPGIDAMVSTWANQPNILAHSGANRSAEEQAQIRYFTVKGVKFAHLSYTTRTVQPGTPFSINFYNSETAKQQITDARKNAKLVFVSITWGNEDQSAISGDQDRIAQELATAGADVVFGNGPHVLQAAKVLNGVEGHQTLVWFSLGNFLNSQLPINNLIGGMAVMDFDAATGQLKDPRLVPVYMHYEWTAAQKAAGTVNARTNFKLFPLDQAAEALGRSQNGTTVEAQTQRVTEIITSAGAPIKIIKSTEL